MSRPAPAPLDLLTASAVAAAVVALVVPPVAQWPEYHDFADRRAWLGVANFNDVASNLPFSLIGLAGLTALACGRVGRLHDARERWPWVVFFLGLTFLGPASAYYHLAPDNTRLMLDRLAMAVTFMGWLAIHLAERLGVRLSLRLLPVLLGLGVGSVFYWYATEMAGHGDLRAWGYVQFWPVVLVSWLLARTPARYTATAAAVGVYACYALALAAEWLDRPIFVATERISGHTLKHLIAAAGCAWALAWLMTRRPLPGGRGVHPADQG